MLVSKGPLTLVLCLGLSSFTLASEFVPLLLWSNTNSPSCPLHKDLGPGETVFSVFTDQYLECLKQVHPKKVFMFTHDKLSIEDFTLLGNTKAFTSIRNYISKYNTSLVVPSIEPANIVDDLFAKLKQTFKGSDIETISLKPVDRLSQSATILDFASRDKEIKESLDKFQGNYIAIVTAENVVKREISMASGSSRHLLAIEETANGTTYFIGNCTYMAYESLTLYVGPNKTELLASNSPTISEVCAQGNSTNSTSFNSAVMVYNTSANSSLSDVSVRYDFMSIYYSNSQLFWWNLAGVTVNYTINGEEMSRNLNPRGFNLTMTAPVGWSFACQAPGNISYVGNTTDNQVHLEFVHVQIQSFDVSNNTFSRALDCEGWFTGPIWMGLLVGLLMIVMLFYGLGMVSQVTTMDRFDDPKSKTITVPQVD